MEVKPNKYDTTSLELNKYKSIILIIALIGIILTSLILWFCVQSNMVAIDVDLEIIDEIARIYILLILISTITLNIIIAVLNISLVNSRKMPLTLKIVTSLCLCILNSVLILIATLSFSASTLLIIGNTTIITLTSLAETATINLTRRLQLN